MRPERWQKISELFDAALELEPKQRAAYLEQVCSGDLTLRQELEGLISSHEHAEGYLESPGLMEKMTLSPESIVAKIGERMGIAVPAPPGSVPVGRRIGPYRILSEVGHGGMGAVYRAVRDDDQFLQQVAIKLVREGMDSDFVKRFKAERQILANLEHPNIARLIDGGTTEEGCPYFSMEYVEGQPLDRYCASHGLSTRQQLELFRSVCSAVQYAHQRLVIHRDLKPSNILVTEDGTPKLLDFGIAKLLDAENGQGATMTGMPLMTPEYASPEQVKGESVTTASDVYSLGMVLYELLVRQRAYSIKTSSPVEIARVVCQVEPGRPSARAPTRELSRQLAGDLDTIVLKAVRKEPARRYASVQELSEDIRRHLEGLPVLARGDSTLYRAGKFVRRHKAAVAAAALVGLSLVGGMAATARQARIAEANRARADRRFNEVRKLANAVLFKYHDGIQKLPGSTAVREMLLNDALEYLDNLNRDSKNDPSLLRELAAAYQKVGDVQGGSNLGNIGDSGKALKSYRKALAIWEEIAALHPADTEDQRNLAQGYLKMGMILHVTGDDAAGLQMSRKALAISQAIAEANPTNPKFRGDLARGYWFVADSSDGLDEKTANFRRAAVIYEDLALVDPQHRRNAALSYKYLTSSLKKSGDLGGALEVARRALAIDQQRAASDPTDSEAKLDLSFSHSQVGYALKDTGDPANALSSYQEALKLQLAIAEADPKNARIRLSMSLLYVGIGDVLAERGDLAAALEVRLKSVDALEKVARDDPANKDIRARTASSYFDLGETYALLASSEKSPAEQRIENWRAARSWFQRSSDLWAELRASDRSSNVFQKESEKVAQQIARSEEALAKFGNVQRKGTAPRLSQ